MNKQSGEETMNRRSARVLVVLVSVLIFSFSGFAQQEGKKKWKSASLDSTTGLFKVWDAEALRKGETNFTFGYDQFQRDPGQLTIGRAPAGVAIGILDRLEFFESMDVQRHITGDNIAIYQQNAAPAPAMIAGSKQNYFTQAAPFIDAPRATGRSDFHLGLKFNILSEFRGKPISLGIAGFGTLPGQRTDVGLKRGLSAGSYQGGFAFLLSKTAKDAARLYLNLGPNFYSDPNRVAVGVQLANLQNEFMYKLGAEFMPYKRIRPIVELSALKYFGDATAGLNPSDPIDLIFGLRVYPREWMSLGAGYQASLRHSNSDVAKPAGALAAGHNGFVVQGAFGIRRNDPPKLTCAVAKNSILQGDTTTIRANAVDPDGDPLTYAWTTTGGKVSGTGETATFDATNIAPGKYTVTGSVSDDHKHKCGCSTEITVLKRNHAPTVAIEPTSATMTQGESANFRAVGSDPDNDALTYTWTVNGQPLAASGPQITFGSSGRKPGDYTIACTVSDGEASANSSAKATIKERIIPNQPPTIECLTTTMDVDSGKSIELRAKASDPDGDRLTYTWSSTGGAISGSGETVTFNAAGVKAGSYTVSVTVNDGRGGKASCSMTVNVSERLSVTKEKCGYFAAGGNRVDNCAKAILDDLAVRMKNDPKLIANLIGYTDASKLEKSKKKLGESRAKAAAAYLEKQGVEASRLKITDGGANNSLGDNKKEATRKLNRRIEIEITVR
jgi:outer membrane protein OmpA-like peptidoglycan-associated protein